jgi:hypothetical protein
MRKILLVHPGLDLRVQEHRTGQILFSVVIGAHLTVDVDGRFQPVHVGVTGEPEDGDLFASMIVFESLRVWAEAGGAELRCDGEPIADFGLSSESGTRLSDRARILMRVQLALLRADINEDATYGLVDWSISRCGWLED